MKTPSTATDEKIRMIQIQLNSRHKKRLEIMTLSLVFTISLHRFDFRI